MGKDSSNALNNVRLKVQEWFGIGNFPYGKALDYWSGAVKYRHAEPQ